MPTDLEGIGRKEDVFSVKLQSRSEVDGGGNIRSAVVFRDLGRSNILEEWWEER